MAETRKEAVCLQLEAARQGRAAVLHRAMLVEADALARQGDLLTAEAIAWTVLRWATDDDDPLLRARSHARLAAVYHHLGDKPACWEHSVIALETLPADAPVELRFTLLVNLGNALSWSGAHADARGPVEGAGALADEFGDPSLQLEALNCLTIAAWEADDADLALAGAEALLALARRERVDVDANTWDTVCRAQLLAGRLEDAEASVAAGMGKLASNGYQHGDLAAELVLTQAETQRRLGDLVGAAASVDRAASVAAARGLADVGLRVLETRARLCADAGDFAGAYRLHREFHEASVRLAHEVAMAQAQRRHSAWKTEEAQLAAVHFLEQARTDQLTGLPNRRVVDDELPSLLLRARRAGTPLCAAFVDVDRFKRINDTLSHEVGDRVLVALADVTRECLGRWRDGGSPDAFAARVGGEELVVVLPSVGLDVAAELMEQLRVAVRSFDWGPLIGELSPVTVSVGVAAASPTSTQSSLLAAADGALYGESISPDGVPPRAPKERRTR